MSNVPSPGLNNQATVRTGLRTVGLVLGLGGFAAAIFGFGSLAYTMMSGDPFAEDSHMGLYFACFGAGAFLGVIGMGMANAGFMGATNRYIAGETVPVIKDSAAYLTDGEGLLGVGRTVDDPDSKFCTSCGKPSPEAARFCESCGHAYA